jgi:hypothetical protein
MTWRQNLALETQNSNERLHPTAAVRGFGVEREFSVRPLAGGPRAPGRDLSMRHALPHALWLLAVCCSDCGDACGNQVVARVPSPDGLHVAVVFVRDCGATTDFGTHVSLLDANEALPPEGGNTFIADTDHGAAPHSAWGGPEVKIRWSSNTRLAVSYDPAARTFRRDSSRSGVAIVYESLNP